AARASGCPRRANRNLVTVHTVPRRSLLFVSQGRKGLRPPAIGNWYRSMKKVRATLDRVLSKAGIASRTTTREWIQQGRVKVNGRVIRNPDFWVEQKDAVHFDGARVREEKKIYIALNKPTGVVTSTEDKKNRPTVYDCVKDLKRWVFAVGRLDMDTSGLLILT